MKFNILSLCSLLFLFVIIIYSPLTLAAWTEQKPATIPRNVVPRTCVEWITYYDFTEGDYDANRAMSQQRASYMDQDASTWAAIYAYVIDEIVPTNRLLPAEFCYFVSAGNYAYRFKSLRREVRNCEGWIHLYMFTVESGFNNVMYARNQNSLRNFSMSIWADSYSTYLVSFGHIYALTPREYCSKIGLPVMYEESSFMHFMCEFDTAFTCEGWIRLYDFHDHIEYNYQKATRLETEETNFHISVHYWPMKYAKFLRTNYLSGTPLEDMTPGSYCKSRNDDITLTYSFYYNPIFED